MENHPFSELFYTFSSDLIEKAAGQTVSLLIKQGQKFDPIKIFNALIIPNPNEKLVSTKAIEYVINYIWCNFVSCYNVGFGNNQIFGVQYSLPQL